MKRMISVFLSVVLLLSLLCGCESSQQEETENTTEESTGQIETTIPVETEPEVEAEPEEIVNNGGLAVRCGNTHYYWGCESTDGKTVYILMKEMDGASEQLLQSYVRSNIYISNDKIFVNYKASEDMTACLMAIDRKDGAQQTVEGIQAVGVDDETEHLVVLQSAAYAALNTVTMELSAIAEGKTYLDCSGGRVFFSETSEDLYSASLWMYNLTTEQLHSISTATADYGDWGEPGFGYSGCEIVHVHQTEQYIYYSYGYYGGTGYFFQSGGLACVSKKDGTTKVLSTLVGTPDSRGGVFYVFNQDGAEYVRCYEAYDQQVTICVDTGETATTDYQLGFLGETFPVIGDGYWISDKTDGQVKQILPPVTLDVADGVTYYCTDVHYTGVYVFYDVIYQKENPNWTSWRDMTVKYLCETYRYDPQTGEAVLLCYRDL